MAEVREPGGLGFKVIAILGIIFFLVVVAVLINWGGDDDATDVAAVGPAVTTPAPTPTIQPATQAPPVGAVATGGGGTAGEGAGPAPLIFAGLAALAVVTAGGVVMRRRIA